jgi:hypothetical protein
MRERFSEIEKVSTRNRSLEERLKDHAGLKVKFERMLDIIENAASDVEKAAEAERRVIEELRQMGNEVLHSWARISSKRKRSNATTQPG